MEDILDQKHRSLSMDYNMSCIHRDVSGNMNPSSSCENHRCLSKVEPMASSLFELSLGMQVECMRKAICYVVDDDDDNMIITHLINIIVKLGYIDRTTPDPRWASKNPCPSP